MRVFGRPDATCRRDLTPELLGERSYRLRVNLNMLTGCAVSGGSTIEIKIAISMP